MSSRTLSQRDNVKRMRRLFQILKIGGLDVNDDECLNSEYEDESLASEQLEISLESDLLECSSVSTAKSNSGSSRKVRRKAVWRENVITDMVDKICSSEYLSTNLIFRNTTRARKTAIYRDVMKQLKERLASRGENFPSDVTKTKNRFKKWMCCWMQESRSNHKNGYRHQTVSRREELRRMVQPTVQLCQDPWFVHTRNGSGILLLKQRGKVLRLWGPPRQGQTHTHNK